MHRPVSLPLILLSLGLAAPAAAEDNIDPPPPELVHHVRFGFAMDTALQAVDSTGTIRTPVETALGRLKDDGLVGGLSQLPDVTVNRVTSARWPNPASVEPAASSAFLLRPLLDHANVMVGMEDLPYDPWAVAGSTCQDLMHAHFPIAIYAPWSIADACDAMAETGLPSAPGPNSMENRFPPIFDQFPVPFGATEYSAWVKQLGLGLAGTPGEVTWETGTEPDGARFFWGDSADMIDKGDAIWLGTNAAAATTHEDTQVFYGGMGSATMLDLGRAQPGNHTDFDDFRFALDQRMNPASGISFHLFPNHFQGGIREKSWDDMHMSIGWFDFTTDDLILSSFDVYGRITPGYTRSMKQSSWLVMELAELLYLAQSRDIEQIYFWKLVDFCGKGPAGFFDLDGEPTPAYHRLLEVWNVVKGGYAAYDAGDGILVVGTNGRVLRTYDSGGAPAWSNDQDMLMCKTNDLGSLAGAPDPVAIQDAFADMDWVIYEPVPAGTGLPCVGYTPSPAPIATAPGSDDSCWSIYDLPAPPISVDTGSKDPRDPVRR
ncbi:MAG: hypothetical protein GY898_18115 [Proteobacteria bacterium]|nr:hypothetical protein [Pseudomonadota bacterium]